MSSKALGQQNPTVRRWGQNHKRASIKMPSILLSFLAIAGFLGYVSSNQRIAYLSSRTFLDVYIPFVPHFVIPYLLLFPFVLFSVVLLWKTSYRIPFLLTLVISLWSAILFWFFFPTFIVRPEVVGNDFFSNLVSFVYAHDAPRNEFPSSHVFLSVISAYFLIKAYPSWFYFVSTVAVCIVISTVFIKQHYLLDVFGGMAFAIGAIALAGVMLHFWPQKTVGTSSSKTP